MKKALLMLIGIIIAFSAISVFAQSQQQFAKFPLSPSYAENFGTKPIEFILPIDNILFSKIVSVEVHFSTFQKLDTTYFLEIDGSPCDGGKFFAEGTGQKEIIFDCTSQVSNTGKYTLSLSQTNNILSIVSSVYGWSEITYYLPEEIKIDDALSKYRKQTPANLHFSGTDYWKGETSTIFIQLTDSNGLAVDNASCRYNLYNASNVLGTPIFSNTPLVYQGTNGLYFNQFSTSSLSEGVYPMTATCAYVFDNLKYYDTGSLQTVNITTTTGTLDGGNAIVLNDPTTNQYVSWTAGGGGLNVSFIWRNLTANITGLDLIWYGQGDNTRVWVFSVFNFTSGKFVNFINLTADGDGGGGLSPVSYNQLITIAIPTPSNFINSSNELILRIFHTGGMHEHFKWLTLRAYANQTTIQDVRGSSEVHIFSSNITNAIFESQLTGRIINATANRIESAVNLINLTLSSGILSAINENNLTLRRIENNTISINGTINNILGFSQNINATLAQVFSLANATNLTSNQILSLLQSVNSTIISIKADTNTILSYLSKINLTQDQEIAFLASINASVNKNIFLNVTNTSVIINVTNTTFAPILVSNVTLVDNSTHLVNITINQTIINSVFNITNTTVVVNTTNTTTDFTQVLYAIEQINQTTKSIIGYVYEINLTSKQILSIAQSTNLTANQIYALLQSVNATVVDNNNIIRDVNQTVYMNKATLAALLVFAASINLTSAQVLAYSQDINGTVYFNKAQLNTILGLANNTNTTVALNKLLLLGINNTVTLNYQLLLALNLSESQEQAFLQNINNTVTSNNNYLVNLTNIVQNINLTNSQILSLIQALQSNINNNFSFIINNITFKVNTSEIVEAILGADVSETLISAPISIQQNPTLLGGISPITGNAAGVVYAADNGVQAFCSVNSSLVTSYTVLRCVNNVCNTITTNTTQTCQFGCDGTQFPNRCNLSETQTNIWIFVIAFLIVLVSVFLLLKAKRRL